MAAAALLSVTLVPVLVGYWIRGRVVSARANPLSWLLMALYQPVLRLALAGRWAVVVVTLAALGATAVPFSRLGSEFMPPLWEGDLLYMPTTLPGVSITKAREILQQTDRILRTFPEVEHVFGKVGRADTATDPAPLSMLETTIKLKPEDAWRPGMTPERLTDEMNRAIRFPGVTNAWTMPIKTRIDMLSTGIKTPVGIKISGPDLAVLEAVGRDVEAVVRGVPGTRSAYAERVMGGNYLNFSVRRDEIARYGLTVGDVQDVIQTAIGGMNITTTVEGLERYPVNLRYSRDLRDNPAALRDILVQTPTRQQIPLGLLTTMSFLKGPPAIKSEQARPNAWVYVDIEDVDVGTYVERGPRSGLRTGRDPHRLQPRLERPVRVHGARRGAHAARGADHPAVDLPDHLRQHALGRPDAHRALGGAPVSHRHVLAALCPRLQPEHRRLGGHHRARRSERGDRGGDAALPRPRLRRRPRRRAIDDARRAPRSSVRRRGAPRPAGGDAERHHRVGTVAHHVEHRHRGRRDEADRGADGRRGSDDGRRRAARLSGRLLHLAGLGTAARQR